MTVSVVLCTYNGAKWLPPMLQSLLQQTRLPDEIVVCDDRSDDNTLQLVQSFAARAASLFRIQQNEKRLGPVENFRQGILAARGEIIFLADQDDEWLPEKIERMLQCFAQTTWADAVACDAHVMEEGGQLRKESFWQHMQFIPQGVPGGRFGLASFLLSRGNVVSGAMLAFRKSSVTSLLMAPIPTEVYHDYWLAIYFSLQQALHLTPQPLIKYRVHPDQQIGIPTLFTTAADIPLQRREHWQQECTALSFGIWRLRRLRPALMISADMDFLVTRTETYLLAMLQVAKTLYFRSFSFPLRKWRLLKHRLKGGEYLMVSFRDLISI